MKVRKPKDINFEIWWDSLNLDNKIDFLLDYDLNIDLAELNSKQLDEQGHISHLIIIAI